jgi:hypothetical protein
MGTASSAEAKGDGFALISGPGLEAPIVLTDPADVAAVFWGGGLGERYRMDGPGPSSPLGPRYQILFVLWEDGSGTVTLRQDLYPFAEGGTQDMWTFTLPGQPWYGSHATPGWWLVSGNGNSLLRAGLVSALSRSFRTAERLLT